MQCVLLLISLFLVCGVASFQATVPTRKLQPATIGPNSRVYPSRRPNINVLSFQRIHPSRTTRLQSLNELVQDIQTSATAASSGEPRTIFVGGKGGVGKTTISSALAVHLASSSAEADLKVLVVSTDPAHSLGDAMDADLRGGRGAPVLMTDPLTGGRLHAAEVDTERALREFQSNLEAFDVERLATALGVSPELLEGFGLGELSGLLNNPPPGLDELVALSNVLDNDSNSSNSNGKQEDYDVVVVDTAPTGHTLRLLALPAFLDGLLGKLIKLRMKLTGLASTLQSLLGDAEASRRAQTIDNAVNRLEHFQRKMSGLRAKLKDPSKTSFVVVSVPTKLSVAETKRLMNELDAQGVTVTDVVVNQVVGEVGDQTSEGLKAYYERRKAGQQKWIGEIRQAVHEVSASEEYQSNGSTGPIALTEVPFLDVELVGVPALAYLGSQCFKDNPNFSFLMEAPNGETKVTICGGKGGVGKTTTSAALAVTMAAQGHNVALISTDPAHSLGDAIDMNLSGGALTDCALIGVPPTEGSLKVMEIDPSAALGQFKSVVDQLVASRPGGSGTGTELGNTLKELGEIFDTLPAGTDEVVALAKVINLVKKGNFDRIVLDTAPTGHTLRMLTTPGFFADLIDRLLAISNKINSNAALKMLISSSGRGEEYETASATAKSTLLSFQLQMWDLEDLFANPDQTDFLIVAIATELAARESIRLLNDLTFEAPDMPIKVRNVVVNQVLDGTDAESFLSRVHDGQVVSIEELERTVSAMARPPAITQVQYLDTEPRGVFGLKVLAEELLKEPSKMTL